MTAARVAESFGLDPIAVLDADRLTWLIRVAAHQVIVTDHRRAVEDR